MGVPEHSIPLMRAISGGEELVIGQYLFFHKDDWLMGIGYPLSGPYRQNEFAAAVQETTSRLAPQTCFAISPDVPPGLGATILEQDRYYVLPAREHIPARLRNPVKKALQTLTIRESAEFTPGHRRLWGEFLGCSAQAMNERVSRLYSAAPDIMGHGEFRLLDALDDAGRIVASLLLDYTQPDYVSYILGAHSRDFYAPHASDALFAAMQKRAREKGKKFIHLGLGVNAGILNFKKKWGAIPSWPFAMYQWTPPSSASLVRTVALGVLRAPAISARQALQHEPEQRPFAMLWKVEKAGRVSWLGGTAHFFRYSFQSSFESLFRKVENVIFEGPLDAEFMAKVDEAGRQKAPSPLIDGLTKEEIRRLERVVNGPTGKAARMLGLESGHKKPDLALLLSSSRVWYAFFILWTAFLERKGWRQSVDMEAWRIAREMGKNVIGMETLAEQLESLESLPRERALRFFRDCASWPGRARSNMAAYLAGDLEKMIGSSAEFPTRTEHIVGRRDQRFRERMRPWLAQGGTAVFVGSAHLVNLRHMLREDGFEVTQKPFGLWPRLHLQWRGIMRPDERVTW